MTVHIGDLKARANRAIEKFEGGRKSLFRADGETKIYSDDEHAERLGALRSERNTVLTEVEEQVRTAIQEANAQITNLEHRDPTELLTTEELERANQKRAFAVDAAETLDTGSLVSRLEAVLSGGDKGAIFAAWSGGQRRRARILERRRENARRASDNPGVATQVTHATELDDVLGRMHGALDGGRTASEIEAAKQRIGEAFDLQQAAHLGIREQGSVYSPQYAVPGPQ